MNQPPKDFILVRHEDLHALVVSASRAVGVPEAKATRLADLLVANDLRGVFSHGTTQIATYAILMRDGKLNPRPDVQVVKETAVSLTVDGDGGLGYFASSLGTEQVVAKAEQAGIAVMLSRNHGHFGAAGIYARMALGHDLLCYVTSGHQLQLQPGQPLYDAAGGSPMAFTAPTDKEDPVVLDFGAMHDLYGPPRDELAKLAPGLVLRSIGLGEICQAWGGLLAGLHIQDRGSAPDPGSVARGDPYAPLRSLAPERRPWTWPGANQGSLVIAFRIDLFADPVVFKQDMDTYVRTVRALEPLEGFDRSLMPGGIEAIRERQYREEGVPVGPEHRSRLERMAKELGISVPW